MQHTDEYIEIRHSAARGTSRLYTQRWSPDGDARAAVLLVHGLGEHSSRYAHVAAHLVERGFPVYAIDHYGHGKSDGLPGYVERFSIYLDGVNALLDEMQAAAAGRPLFLLGHSMGGLIAMDLLAERQAAFAGCILSGPALKSDAAPPPAVQFLVRLLSVILPTLPLLQLDPASVSRDPQVVDAYVRDPLVHHGRVSARLVAEFSAAADAALARAAETTLPLLILHGGDDRLTMPAGSEALHDAAGSEDKTLKIYPGLYHEIFNEPEREAVLADLSTWLEEHLP